MMFFWQGGYQWIDTEFAEALPCCAGRDLN